MKIKLNVATAGELARLVRCVGELDRATRTKTGSARQVRERVNAMTDKELYGLFRSMQCVAEFCRFVYGIPLALEIEVGETEAD
jgi:hypothetical protein